MTLKGRLFQSTIVLGKTLLIEEGITARRGV